MKYLFTTLLLVFIFQNTQAQQTEILFSKINQQLEGEDIIKAEILVLDDGKVNYTFYRNQSPEYTIKTAFLPAQLSEFQKTLSYTKLRHLKRQYQCNESEEQAKHMYTFNTKRWQSKTFVIGDCKNAYLKKIDAMIEEFIERNTANTSK